ncbi:hypothetical protein [Edwardsiella tarda]|uniref:hypothetical protein n=1 Tax=Edwardsiella tarda TaxID=636 RepID=UPI000554039F
MRVGAFPSDGISGYLKCHITSPAHDMTVVGYIAEGSTGQLTNNWNSPFEGDSVGSMAGVSTVANIGQSKTGYTSVSKLNSEMIWEGTQAPSFQISLYFQAIRDAKLEVQDPIMCLMQMASPMLNDVMPMGRIPSPCVLDIGRRFKVENLIIQDISYELDAPRTRDGYFTHNTVSLQCSAKQMLNANEVSNLFVP